jgi:hypothetical protein
LGGAAVAEGSQTASSAAGPTAAASPSQAPAIVVQPASLPLVRPAPTLVDLPLVRLLVIAVIVGAAAAVLPRAVRWRR